MILSTILAGLFFVVMTYAEVLGFKGAPTPLNETPAPMSFLAQQAGVGFLGVIVTVGAMVSFFACTLASLNAGARILFTMARHGIFHPAVGSAHTSNQTPHVAVTMTALFAFLVPASMSMFGLKILDMVAYLGTIANYGFLLAYILVSIAAPIYLHRIRQLRFLDVAIAVVAVVFMIIPVVGSTGLPGSELFPVPVAPYNVFPFLFLMYLVVGGGWLLMLRLHSPEVIEDMERDIEAIHTKFNELKKV